MSMVIQLRCVLIHYMLSMSDGIILAFERIIFHRLGAIRDKKPLDVPQPCRCLVHLKCGCKFLVRSNFDRVQQQDGERLTVIANEIVCRLLFSHIVNDHLAWEGRRVSCGGD